MMCGLLLARAGVDVWVLEKHKDFLRDFRGDTVHPSTLQIMDELGLLEKFLTLPHQEASEITAEIGKESFKVADMSRLPTRAKFVALMPQWDFLDFLAGEARRYPNFHLAMETEVVELLSPAPAHRGRPGEDAGRNRRHAGAARHRRRRTPFEGAREGAAESARSRRAVRRAVAAASHRAGRSQNSRSAASSAAICSRCSIAAIIGNARCLFRRAAWPS